jgi:nicotinate-nucleotide pyrophosphorylase (carboxylating)
MSRPRRRPTAHPPGGRALDRFLDGLLLEDRVDRDRTTAAVLAGPLRADGRVVAQAAGRLSGAEVAARLARRAGLRVVRRLGDGAHLRRGTVVLRVEGDAHRLLGVERTLLNLLMHLSGVATATARAVAAAGGRIEIRGTRKTLPGLRDLEKAAIVHGGGAPHRRDLSQGILVKNNHLALVDLADALRALRAVRPPRPPLEVEVRSLSQARTALAAGAEELLLDNLSPDAARRMVRAIRQLPGGRRIPLELSGGIRPQNVARYARSGADSASLGALTHSAPALPFHLVVRRSGRRPARGGRLRRPPG